MPVFGSIPLLFNDMFNACLCICNRLIVTFTKLYLFSSCANAILF